MRALLAVSHRLVVVCVVGVLAHAEESPRSIIERAVKAQGADRLAETARAVRATIKGRIFDIDGGEFTGEYITQLPGQLKVTLHTDAVGIALSVVELLNRDKGLIRISGQDDMTGPDAVAELKRAAYVEHVGGLSPLLAGKEYVLSSLDGGKLGPHEVAVVLVTARGYPDVKLFFDKTTHLLVKTEYTGRDPKTKKETLHEQYLSDYREVKSSAADEESVKVAKIGTDGPTLLAYLRQHTLSEAELQKVQGQIRKLGDPSFQVREKAKEDLVALGARAAPVLSQALKDPDPEIASRTKECLERIGESSASTVIPSVIRLLAEKKPPGLTEALLGYLPSAATDIQDEIERALAAVARRADGPDKSLVAAEQDTNPVRREAAAKALKDSAGDPDPPGRRLTIPGYRRFTKCIEYHDGRKVMEFEFTNIQLYNKLDESVFAKP